MNIEKMREEFEAWAVKGEWHIDLLYDHGYAAWETQCAFDVWQASREALVIELPKVEGIHCDAQKYMRNGCRRAIEAAGLKVKP